PRYIQNLQRQANILPDEIKQLQDAHPSSDQARQKIQTDIAKKQEVLAKVRDELTKWHTERLENLSPREKQLYQKAFVVNAGDPNYRSISSISYTQNGEDRKVTVPAGDVLHQFRQDVDNGQLPMVSWLAAPQNFSDHPSAPMYG